MVTAIYAFSPILFYAMYQAALGQLLAAPAVALLTWVGVPALITGRGLAAALRGVLRACCSACNWLHPRQLQFLHPLRLRAAGLPTWAVARCWRRDVGEGGALVRCSWLCNLLVCALLFPGRVMSLADRFRLFDATPFGWRIPALRAAGWYGLFADAKLQPATSFWPPLLAAAALADAGFTPCAGRCAAGRASGRWRRRAACRSSSATASCSPSRRYTNDNSSYDAYKLFTVFYPGILRGPVPVVGRGDGVRAALARGPSGPAGCALRCWLCNVAGAWRFNAAVRLSLATWTIPWRSSASIEQMPQVLAVNVCLIELLAAVVGQLFPAPQTPVLPRPHLRGPAHHAAARQLGPVRQPAVHPPFRPPGQHGAQQHYYLVRHRCRDRVQAMLASGWYCPNATRTNRWIWCRGHSPIALSNPHPYPLHASVDLTLRSMEPRRVQVWLGRDPLWEGTVGPALVAVKNMRVPLPMGVTFLRLETPDPISARSPGESPQLAFALYHLQVDLLTPPPARRRRRPLHAALKSSPEESIGIEPRAYRIMRAVEDAHWWFDGMEAITARLLAAAGISEERGPGDPRRRLRHGAQSRFPARATAK